PSLLLELSRGGGRYERIRVDLSVRVPQRHADLLAAVLEREDVSHVLARPEDARAVGPHLDEELHVPERERRERARGVLRVDDDLAAPQSGARGDGELGGVVRQRGERGKKVLEDGHVPGAGRDLRRVPRVRRRRERVVRGRKERALLAV